MDGWLIINKPIGVTSNMVNRILKKRFHQRKIGHVGTLDPLAHGVLPIALGYGCRLIPYDTDTRKTYVFWVEFGYETNTLDAEGMIVKRSECQPSTEAIRAALHQFEGTIQQVPPAFSARRVDGCRAYELARAGDAVELSPRTIQIDHLELLTHVPPLAQFKVQCHTGTYVRSLGADLARALGTVGSLTDIQRIRSGRWTLEHSVTLEDPLLHQAWIPLDQVLSIPVRALEDAEAQQFLQGRPISCEGGEDAETFLLKWNEHTLGIGVQSHQHIHPRCVFPIRLPTPTL
jgi:tRNA pseudouridine55 synthase